MNLNFKEAIHYQKKKPLNQVIFIIGVSGVGKSTVGQLLSDELSIPYFDGDDFHSEENIAKMSSGQPLNDEDREGWLIAINKFASKKLAHNSFIIACSALKQKYREILQSGMERNVNWVHLFGSFDQIFERINSRSDHFMSSELLQSQFDILEDPINALQINVNLTPEEIVQTIKSEMGIKSQFGLFGLGVMGKSLCRNLSRNGFKISMFNRHVEGVEENIAQDFKAGHPELSHAVPFDDIAAFVDSLQRPRKIMLMVNAGNTVDLVIENLLPHLSKNDILIDGGNSNYVKTNERVEYLKTKNIHFIGAGVSGGENGALTGPSIMPSGSKEGYKNIESFLGAVAAKDQNNLPCCTYIGPEGSGHFVKMVHNGIEYVEMQLLAEIGSILAAQGQNQNEIANTLESWKDTTNSYLLEITINIFRKKEGEDWLLKKILDKAGNKGTGNWTTIASAQLGVPSTLIAAALFARYTSFNKEERIVHSENFSKTKKIITDIDLDEIRDAYQFARIINHYQGFKLLDAASISFSWDLNLSEIARIWTNGCIIKSTLMEELVPVLSNTNNILINQHFRALINQYKPAIKIVVAQSIANEIAVPCLSESVQFFNGITRANSSANIIQAQRDYFGAHTYKRIDDDSGKNYHTNWN